MKCPRCKAKLDNPYGCFNCGWKRTPSSTKKTQLKNNDQSIVIENSVVGQAAQSAGSGDIIQTGGVTMNGNPGQVPRKSPTSKKNKLGIKTANGDKVFVVHGHDEQAREAVARFLEKIELEAIILHEQPNAGNAILEKLEKYSDVNFAVVLLTPDDIGTSKNKPNDLKHRARQNVIFELGFFISKLGRNKVCALYKEGVELPSDYQGILYIVMDTSDGWRLKLAKELKNAGLNINLNRVI